MNNRHKPVHLRCEPARDVDTYRLKRRRVYVLRTEHGGRYFGNVMPETLCGTRGAKRIVAWKERERVTCPYCRRLMLVRLPKPPPNPRSGMAMPRPHDAATEE